MLANDVGGGARVWRRVEEAADFTSMMSAAGGDRSLDDAVARRQDLRQLTGSGIESGHLQDRSSPCLPSALAHSGSHFVDLTGKGGGVSRVYVLVKVLRQQTTFLSLRSLEWIFLSQS